MSILDKLVGSQLTQPIEAIGNVLDKLFTSDEERLDKQTVLARLAQAPAEAQVELNKVEAQHRSTFVAGWRPFIGWVGGCGLAFVFLVNPIIQWVSGKPGPEMPISTMYELVIAMLGLGALRTIEKFGGRAK